MAPKLASSAVYSTVGIAVQGLARLAYTVVIGRSLGTETLGHASALMSLSIFLALFWPTAAGNTASRFIAVALHRGEPDRALVRALDRVTLLTSLVLGVAAVPVALWLGNGLLTALGAGWLVIGYGWYTYARGAQLGHHRARRIALWDTVSSVTSLGLLIVVALGGLDGLVLVPLAVGYTVFAVTCRPRATRGDDCAVDAPPGLMTFAAWNVVAGLTTNGLLQIAMLAAQVYGGSRDAGVYAAAFTLATPASMLGQAVSQIVVPAYAHRGSEAGLRDRGSRRFFLAFCGLSALVFGLVGLLAPVVLPVVYPQQGVAAVPMLQYLMVGVFLFTVGLIPSALLLAAGRSRVVALTSVGGFVVGVVVVLVLGPHQGVSAGSTGFLAGSAVNLAALVVLASRRLPAEQGARPDDGAPAPVSTSPLVLQEDDPPTGDAREGRE